MDRLVEVISSLDDPSALVTTLEQWAQEPDQHPVSGLAVITLARIGQEAGLTSLLALFADGEQATTSTTSMDLAGWIREGLTHAQQAGVGPVRSALESLDLTDDRDVLTALILLRLLDYQNGGQPTTELASQWSFKLWEEVPALETRHHLLAVAKRLISLGCSDGVELASLALSDPDGVWMLRMEALMALATAGADLAGEVVTAAVTALQDEHPAVRSAAALCLRRVGACGVQVEPPAITAAESDPWPEVRLEALKLVATFESLPIESVYDFLVDDDSNVRKVAVTMVVDRTMATEEIGILLANTTVDASMRADVRTEAAHAIGQLCIVSMAMPLGNVLYYGIVPGASEAQIQTASAAADSLGRLGEPGPLDKLLMATRPGLRLQIRLAAIRALGMIADPLASDTLEQLASSSDAVIAAAAREALDLVNSGQITSACKTP
jgi:HEAT repeat protein